MNEHLTQPQVDDYCRQQLRAAELLSVSDHLGACAACRQRLETAMNGDARFFALRADVFEEAEQTGSTHPVRTHPTVEQTSGFVDGALAGEELQFVTDHLTICELCALAVDDLRSFRNEIAPTLDHEYRPAPVSTPAEGWWQRMLAGLPGLFGKNPGLALGAAMALLLLVVGGWLVWRTLQQGESKQDIVVAPEPPPTPAPPAPAPAPVVVAQLSDGEGQLALDQEGKLLGADNLPPAYQERLKEALTNQRIQTSSQLKGLSRPSSSLMGTDNEGSKFSVSEPVGKVVMTNRPTFRWSRLSGATGYIAEVYDEEFNLVGASPQLTANSWTIPQELRRGGVYSWQVKAVKDGQEFKSPRPPAPQAKFRVLDQANANELAKARRAFGSSHLVLGLLYAEAGLLKEAEQELRLLQKANPTSEVARTFVSQVQALRR